MPEDWSGGYLAWAEAYEPRLKAFLGVLEAEEEEAELRSGRQGRPGC